MLPVSRMLPIYSRLFSSLSAKQAKHILNTRVGEVIGHEGVPVRFRPASGERCKALPLPYCSPLTFIQDHVSFKDPMAVHNSWIGFHEVSWLDEEKKEGKNERITGVADRQTRMVELYKMT